MGGHERVADRGNSLLQAKQVLLDKTTMQGHPEDFSAAPQAAGWLGFGRWVSKGDLWHMLSLHGESLYARHMPGSCFEEADCRHAHSFISQHFKSVEAWSSYYSSSLGLGLSGGYQGLSGSIDASLGSTSGSSATGSKQMSYAVKAVQRMCYRLVRDKHCAYNRSNLQPALLARVAELPKGSPYTAEKMEAWRASFIQRFGTHMATGSSHGALVQSLVSAETRVEESSACLDSSLCSKFGWVAPLSSNSEEAQGVDLCSQASSCDNRTSSSRSEKTSCVALGGDPALQSKVCQASVSEETLEAWQADGDLKSGSSVFRLSFMPVSEFLTNVDFSEFYEAAQTLEKAIEYSNCQLHEQPPVQVWDGAKCQCVRQCGEGGVLDAASCTCKCRGDLQHGWTGSDCREVYGFCQPGAGTGNLGAARRCRVSNRCSSWFEGKQCKATDVCCATNFGTQCCPFGSSCQCSGNSCQCRLGRWSRIHTPPFVV